MVAEAPSGWARSLSATSGGRVIVSRWCRVASVAGGRPRGRGAVDLLIDQTKPTRANSPLFGEK